MAGMNCPIYAVPGWWCGRWKQVADMAASYAEWKERGAEFLTEPLDNHGIEVRCYMRDPDGRIIEVGQATGMAEILEIDLSPSGQ